MNSAFRFTPFFCLALLLAWSAGALAQQTPPGVRAQGQDVDLGGPGQQQAPAPIRGTEVNDARQEMRDLIRDISSFVRRLDRDFIVVTRGGLELLEKVDSVDSTARAPATTYMRAIDGVMIDRLNFQAPAEGKDDIKTDDRERRERLRLAELATRRGLGVWVTDFADTPERAREAYNLNKAQEFVTLPVTQRFALFNELPKFPKRPFDENPANVTGFKSVKNFLILTDSSNYDSQDDFVLAMNDTNFDAIIVDVFHRGRRPFTRDSVHGLKFKKLGARRLVLAQVNVGQAESFRYYWQDGWREGSPGFVAAPVAGNPDKHYVQYWNPGWQAVVTGNANSYVYGIFAQGFDGIVLDGVDAYRFFEGETR